jgi:hypothetical protein
MVIKKNQPGAIGQGCLLKLILAAGELFRFGMDFPA